MKSSTHPSGKSSGRSTLPDTMPDSRAAPTAPMKSRFNPVVAWQVMRSDYQRHGASLANGAFLSLCNYRFGHWGLHLQSALARGVVSKLYGFINLFLANITKIWIPPQVTIGRDLHIVNNEGSLSMHPDVVIGNRLGVMHNVTIGTNMRPGAPVIGDDVFIGVNATVLGAIRIGDRVRIAANAAVTTNIPSDSIVIGSPAKIYPRLGPFT